MTEINLKYEEEIKNDIKKRDFKKIENLQHFYKVFKYNFFTDTIFENLLYNDYLKISREISQEEKNYYQFSFNTSKIKNCILFIDLSKDYFSDDFGKEDFNLIKMNLQNAIYNIINSEEKNIKITGELMLNKSSTSWIYILDIETFFKKIEIIERNLTIKLL